MSGICEVWDGVFYHKERCSHNISMSTSSHCLLARKPFIASDHILNQKGVSYLWALGGQHTYVIHHQIFCRHNKSTSPNCFLAWQPFIVLNQEFFKSRSLSKVKCGGKVSVSLKDNICYLPLALLWAQQMSHIHRQVVTSTRMTIMTTMMIVMMMKMMMAIPVINPTNVTLCRTNMALQPWWDGQHDGDDDDDDAIDDGREVGIGDNDECVCILMLTSLRMLTNGPTTQIALLCFQVMSYHTAQFLPHSLLVLPWQCVHV